MDISKIFNIFKKNAVINADFSGGGVEIFKDKYSDKSPLTLYGLSLYTNKAIDKRAESVGQTQFVIKDSRNEVVNDKQSQDILNLLNRPNKLMTGFQFWRLYQIYKDVCGEAFILLESKKEGVFSTKTITAMHLLNPERVTVHFNEVTGDYSSFEYATNTGKIVYSPEQIVRDYIPDPQSLLKPMSLIKAGLKNIKTGIQLEDYQSKVLENGGKVETVIKFKAPINKTQLQEAKDSYKKNYSEAKRAGLPLFLGSDADYMRMSLTPEELGYIQSKGLNLNDICLMTGVPKVLLSNVDDIKYANSEESRAVYMRDTIDPLQQALCERLDWSIIPDMGRTLTHISQVPENRDEKRKDLETANNIYAMTINEKRRAIGLEDIDNGDDILIPFNLTPLGSEPEPAKTFDNSEVKKKTEHPLRDYDKRRAYHKAYIKRADKNEVMFLRAFRKYLKDQEQRILENIGEKMMKDMEHFINKDLEINIAFKTFFPILQEVLQKSGENTYESFKLSGAITSWLAEKTEVFARQITDTTFNQLQEQFRQALENGEDRNQIVKRVQDTYKDISKGRAKTIARTEIQGAMQKGTYEGYTQSGVPIKIWVAVIDEDSRLSHSQMDGVEVPINSPFIVNGEALMFPGDPNGSAGNIINCRCSL